MGNCISEQLAMFLRAILLGASLGLVYDLLRVLRRLGGPVWGGLLDAAYCVVLGASVFLFTMAGDGELRLFILMGTAGGMVLFFCLLSRSLLPLWELWLQILLVPVRLAEGSWEKIREICKKLFSFLKSWYRGVFHEPLEGVEDMRRIQETKQQPKKKRKRPSSKLTLLILAILIIGIGVQLRGIYTQLEDARAQEALYAEQLAELQEANARLEEDIANSEDPERIEDIARDELGMVSQGEKIFRFQ